MILFVKDKRGDVRWTKTLVINPLAHLETLYTYSRTALASFIGANLEQFWDKVQLDDPRFVAVEGWLTSRSNWKQRAVPYLIHGDGASFTTSRESLVAVNLKCLLSLPFLAGNIIPLFAVVKSACVGPPLFHERTFDKLWDMVVHFLNSGFDGKHPDVDPEGVDWPADSFEWKHAGKDLCGGSFFMVLWGLPADLEYLGNELKMPHHNSVAPCCVCAAGRSTDSPHKITDVSMDASWKGTLVTAADGIAQRVTTHKVMNIKGASRFHAPGDLQHTGHLGTDQYFLGSVLDELIEDGPFRDGSRETRKNRVWGLILAEYRRQGTSNRLGNLTLGMVKRGDDFPCLSAKASETAHLLKVILSICRGHHDGSERDEHRLRALVHIVRFYKIVQCADVVMTSSQADEVKEAVEWHLLHYNWLHHNAVKHNVRRYVLQFKHHHLWHIACDCKFLNPRFHWCYPFEDFMGILITSARNSFAGSPMAIVGKKVLENWCLVNELSLRYSIDSNVAL